MKIAVPVEGNTTNTQVSASFGRTAYFLIYDEETASSETLENKAAQSAGGAGIQAAQSVVDAGAGIVLAPRCGKNAADVMLAAGVKLYKTDASLSAMDNIKAYKEGRLEELKEIHEGFHKH